MATEEKYKELYFHYALPVGAEKNKIVKVINSDGESINIKWKLKEEDETEEAIQVCNFINEVAWCCRGIELQKKIEEDNSSGTTEKKKEKRRLYF